MTNIYDILINIGIDCSTQRADTIFQTMNMLYDVSTLDYNETVKIVIETYNYFEECENKLLTSA